MANARTSAYQRIGQAHCVDCGIGISRNASRPSERCKRCAGLHRATTVRDATLLCVTCKQWLRDKDFPCNRNKNGARRGRHKQCRACSTIARRQHREREKVPCANGCGRLVSGPLAQEAERRRGHPATGMCRSCALKTKHP
jgi:hypothetical protein